MRLFTTQIIVSSFLYSTSLASLSIIERRNDEIGDGIFDYDCANVFFTNEAVQNAAAAGLDSLMRLKSYPIIFEAPFYDKNLDLVIWPIKEDGKIYEIRSGNPGVYYIVMDWFGDVKDVVAKTVILQFIKCTKLSRSSPVLPVNIQEETDGYDCGFDLFDDKKLADIAATASDEINLKPKIYTRHKMVNYVSDIEQFLWPIPRSQNFRPGSWTQNLYFIILTLDGEVKEVVAKIINGRLLKCSRVRLSNRLKGDGVEEPQEESGYQCGFYFFSMKYLARSARFSKRPQLNPYKRIYPQSYDGPPFNTEVYFYPIFPGGRIFIKGKHGKHYVVISKSFQVIGVAIKDGNNYQVCEQKFRGVGTMRRETGNFRCIGEEFPHDHLMATANLASQYLGIKEKKFPARYVGPDFDIAGPYITWPLIKGGFFKTAPGHFRVVLNGEFQIAGVLTRINKNFYKCKRANDNSIPGGVKSGAQINEIYKLL